MGQPRARQQSDGTLPVKILAAIIVPPHLSASGGARAGLRLSEALAPACDIAVAAMSAIDSERPGGPPRLPVRTRLPQPFALLPARYRALFYTSDIAALIRRGGYDLVHLHNPMPALELARVARTCRAAGVPYVVSTHGFNELARGGEVYGLGLLRRLAWHFCVHRPVSRAVSGAAAVFALSPADFPLVGGFGFAGTPSVVPNGVDPPAPLSALAQRTILQRFELPRREDFPGITCMFLANHTPNKGVPVLFDAFARLDCPYLLIVGGERRPEIDYDRLARTARPDQRIVVTGRLSDEEVGALLRRSDLFVFPTLADTFPLVVLEAMAHGVPVVASDVGGVAHQLDEDCGRLVPAGDPAALAAAVAELAADPPRLRAMGRQARRRASRFTWQAAAEAALQGYRRVCAEPPRAAARPLAVSGAAP
jgi:starch synthase